MADRLNIAELDFDTIKSNLIAFLRQQDEFTDYDFTGSGLNVLVDVLAYNTHYQAYYLNMIANESFLDTAILRDSVVSHAKSLGYTPHSKKAATAIINFQIESLNNTVGRLTLPRGYSFLSNQIDGKSYKFIVLDDISVTKSNTKYFFENISISEGQLVNYSYVHSQSSNPKQIFDIPDESVDVSSLQVLISPSVGNTSISNYTKAVDITDITSDSEVYFIQESKNGKYQIYFGNDVVGKKVPDGGVVYLNYLVTNSFNANKANNFIGTSALADSLGEPLTRFNITPISAATGGLGNESVDSIKYSAPLSYTSQNRLVTFKDYEIIIRQNYPNIDSISVWGGEDEEPPVYGKVFVSLKPTDNYFISENEKSNILNNIIAPKAMVTVRTEIRDPEFLYILLNIGVRYDQQRTLSTKENLKNLIRNTVISYNSSYLNKFGSSFVQSKLEEAINSVDTNSFIGCESTIKAQKRIVPILGVNNNYKINFNIPLLQRNSTNKLSSSEFSMYDNTGILRKVVIEEVPNSFTGINAIQILDPGLNYVSTPTVVITGDGIGATAEAVVVNGRIEKINIINSGIDYSKATITVTGGGGYGVSAVAMINAKICILRTVYYNLDGERVIVKNNIGNIEYDSGIVSLNELNIISTETRDGLIRIECQTQTGIIQSNRNSIIFIDETDPNSVIINLQSV